jgi:ribonuclease inhibitor
MLKTLEGNEIKSEMDFHVAIAEALGLPRHYGKNLDALWDVVARDVERPVTLVWRHSEASRAVLGDRFETIVGVLRRAEQQDLNSGWDERFELRLE